MIQAIIFFKIKYVGGFSIALFGETSMLTTFHVGKKKFTAHPKTKNEQ